MHQTRKLHIGIKKEDAKLHKKISVFSFAQGAEILKHLNTAQNSFRIHYKSSRLFRLLLNSCNVSNSSRYFQTASRFFRTTCRHAHDS